MFCSRPAGQYHQKHSNRSVPRDRRSGGKGRVRHLLPPESALFEEARSRGYIGAGFCSGGYGYMMKRVWAGAGDRVTWGEEGIVVNGEVLPASAPQEADKAGRLMWLMWRQELADHVLGEFELLLISDVSWSSFDGRYFGPVDVGQVRGVIKPLVTF
ncbi:conjugative transfer signal peptidase TraF [Nitrosospira multiformis]|uniref:Conjugative transfer signal peptidase TraF n=1 Tax=Nitrosospira multiformis TaxID=1231 RepID=A0A1I7I6C4_9PROT|nr:conjugative transfer signal peptidase TraF [Nitrosospira multiformis]SFU68500.1 conjugative transfer signal peptidase TraF [Nitrosospira multiformis]